MRISHKHCLIYSATVSVFPCCWLLGLHLEKVDQTELVGGRGGGGGGRSVKRVRDNSVYLFWGLGWMGGVGEVKGARDNFMYLLSTAFSLSQYVKRLFF